MTHKPVTIAPHLPRQTDCECKAHVLIVEDHLDARLVMEEFLEANGFNTSVTKTVAEALALLDGGLKFDLILLDLMLPDRDGTEFLQELRRRPRPTSRPPVVIVSAFAPPEVNGAMAVLHKPVDLAELLRIVEQVVPAVRAEHPPHSNR